MECGGHQTETNLHQDTDNGVNEEEIEDDTNQCTQMFSTLGNEIPSKGKRSVQTQNTLSTAMSSSRCLSQAQLLTEGDVSKIIVSRPASSRVSTPPSSKKSRVSHDITTTVGVSSTSLLPKPQTMGHSDCQDETTVIGDIDEDIDTARDTRTADTTDAGAVVKEEPYEYYLAPSIIKPGYDAENDVEIIEVLGVGSSSQSNVTTSNNKKGYPCSKCKRVFGNKGAWGKHILACPIKETKIKRKRITKHFTCLNCQVTFADKKSLRRHQDQESCKGSGDPAPFQCPKCFKKFARKSTFNVHLILHCTVKGSEDTEMENNDIEDSKEDDPGDLGTNHEGDDLDTDREDYEDTRGDHVSCKECGGRLFTREKFEKHQQLTGHTGDTIKLPQNLILY